MAFPAETSIDRNIAVSIIMKWADLDYRHCKLAFGQSQDNSNRLNCNAQKVEKLQSKLMQQLLNFIQVSTVDPTWTIDNANCHLV